MTRGAAVRLDVVFGTGSDPGITGITITANPGTLLTDEEVEQMGRWLRDLAMESPPTYVYREPGEP